MGVELRPFGVRCNLRCTYCYQNPQRDADNVLSRYSLDVMKAAVEAEGGPFTLFGGEPLLVDFATLEELLAWGYKKYGGSSIQTNGALISDAHIDLFKRYRVGVGISVDGPPELNEARSAGSDDKTLRASQATMRAIKALCDAQHAPSLIVTLHRINATSENLPKLCAWIREIDAMGIRSVRLHLLEVEDARVRSELALSEPENRQALQALRALQAQLKHVRFDMFHDMRRMLLAQDKKNTCVWNGCDPLTTHAVRGVEGNGQRSNCGRTNKEGIDFVKASNPGYERSVMLYETPQEDGGCSGCRFFLMCKGYCPGTGIEGDWRNRTEHCGVLKSLFEALESDLLSEGIMPLSRHARRSEVEAQYIEECRRARYVNIQDLIKKLGVNLS